MQHRVGLPNTEGVSLFALARDAKVSYGRLCCCMFRPALLALPINASRRAALVLFDVTLCVNLENTTTRS